MCAQVDKHIRRLDADLARFENELKDKLDSSSLDSSDDKKSRSTGRSHDMSYHSNIAR